MLYGYLVAAKQVFLNDFTTNLNNPAWLRIVIMISLVLLDLLETLFILCCVHCMCPNYETCVLQCSRKFLTEFTTPTTTNLSHKLYYLNISQHLFDFRTTLSMINAHILV